MTKRETSAEIDETASAWAMRMDEAALGEADQADFDRWLDGDVRRVGAFARAQAVLVHVKRAKALGADFAPDAFKSDIAAREPDDRPAQSGLTRRKLVVGASAIAATGLFAMLLPIRRASAHIYETSRGESRLVPLEDGSTVTLNTQSRIAVTHRSVELLQGEALFKVASADSMPFIIEAGDTSLRATNAIFSVCWLAALPLQVKVCEGSLDLERDSSAAPHGPHRLRANRQAIMPANGTVIERSIAPETLARELAWQEGMLSFEDTPLRQAADEFARYSDRTIDIADPMVGAETVTGRYAANNPEGFARAVALSLNLHMQSTAGGIILTR